MINFLKGMGKSEHERIEEMLSAYMDGELAPAQQARVEAHLAECESCAQNLYTLRQTASLLGQLSGVKAPRSFVIREEQVAPRRQVGFRWKRAYPVLQGATAVAFLLFAVVFSGDVALTRFAPTMGRESLIGYGAPAMMEEPEARLTAHEKAAEETKETPVAEEMVAMAETATPAATPVPPAAPTDTPALDSAGEAQPSSTPAPQEDAGTKDAVPPTEEAMMTCLAEQTAEAQPQIAEATPLPSATPAGVAELIPPERGNSDPSEEAPAGSRVPLASQTRITLWVIEGGLLILAAALLAATLWVRRRQRDWG